MYSLLLMTAMATGGETPAFHWNSAGCGGCTGTVVTSCYGCTGYTSCTGCTGYTSCSGCTGCTGGGLFSRIRAHFASHHNSCCGGCYSTSCTGCTGCTGFYSGCTGCTGCTGCYGTGYTVNLVGSNYPTGNVVIDNANASASSYSHAPRHSGVGYNGYHYSGANYASFPDGQGVRTFAPGYTMGGGHGTGVVGPYFYGAEHLGRVPMGPTPGTLENPLYRPIVVEHKVASEAPKMAPAKLVIEVPADAKLYVDGNLVAGEGSTRRFHTPELPHAKSFYYDIKAVIEINGKPMEESARVIVRAGDELKESFPKLIAAAKAKADALATK